MSCDCDYRDDYFEPTRDDMIRELVEGCDSLADIRAISREMVAELRRQKILRRAERRRWADPPPPPKPKTPEDVYRESLPAEYRAKLAARGPVVMSPEDIEQMKRDVAVVEKRQQLHRAAAILGIKWT